MLKLMGKKIFTFLCSTILFIFIDRTDDTIQKLMRQHERELAALKEQQERSRRDQQDRLQVQSNLVNSRSGGLEVLF